MRLHQSAHPWLGATPFPPAGARHHISVWRRPASPRAPLQLALPRRARPPAAGRRAALAPGRRRCSCTSGELTRRRDRPQAAARLPSAQVSFFSRQISPRQIWLGAGRFRANFSPNSATNARCARASYGRFLRNVARVCLKLAQPQRGSVYRSQPLAIAMKLWYAPTPDVKPSDLIAMRYESYPPIFRHRHRDNSRKKGGGAARRRRGGGGAAAAALPAAAAAAWWWCGCGGAPGVEARAARARTNSEMALAPSVYFSKFATKSAVALSRAKFREIYRARSAAIAFDDRLSRAWFSAQKSLARFARQGHATPTANLSQVTSLDYLTLTIPKTRLASQPTPDALQFVHTRAAQALASWAGREPPPPRAPPRCARNGAPPSEPRPPRPPTHLLPPLLLRPLEGSCCKRRVSS